MNDESAVSHHAAFLRRRAPKMALCLGLALAVAALFPAPAHAALWDAVADFEGWVCNDLLRPVAEDALNSAMSFYRGIAADKIFTGSFDILLKGQEGASGVYDIMRSVYSVVVKPLGHSILALVMLVQVVKISQKIDGTATMPAVKEVLFLGAFYVIFSWFINNSFDLCAAVYEEMNKIVLAVVGENPGVSITATVSLGDCSDASIGVMVIMCVICWVCMLFGLVGWLVAVFMAYARAFQLYVMAAFSPIPFSLLGFEETRSMGIGFCKNFVSVCLAGAIMALLLICFPALVASIDFSGGLSAAIQGDALNALAAPFPQMIQMMALTLLLIFGLIKSGAWARDILGG